ncbi:MULTISPECIES: SDR family NAD(P)-dependent oxidoreductase [unclassified Oceanispirochaeta]|uniref:SDR family NAD(P)-dependent oxidoreductase n=1 Tax=unclassified Oceanispirochaeta TaxID=2635722 RepID=UPI000E095390|nr:MULTISPECIES: SDR family oxidoreductase [unclassified Oceanispirochaeta]MBF9016686.1 SDR family oxidoreductase [Oceanispirochaeta sp. M2]NPD73109.1 SDR family oxidoreductase [Oceanispirochaeta sp. M1]RDG31210.1 SDR family NAD(P)-dependent oxidoreductase [Oceanispirochaeta sp. M1]
MDLGLKGKVALVTGGGSGIGGGISEYLACEGVNVAVNYIVDKPAVEAFVEKLNEKYGTECIAVYADVSKADDLDTMLKEVAGKLGAVEILVNNAGVWPTENAVEMDDSRWERVIDINLNGPYMLSKRVVNKMVEAGKKGVIVNLSSKSAFQYNTGGHAHYATAKAGINMLTRSMAREVSADGIRVVAIAPGMVRTPMNEDKWSQDGMEDYYIKRIPVGKLTEPIEVGYLVAFLASGKAANITGSVVDITGGMLI